MLLQLDSKALHSLLKCSTASLNCCKGNKEKWCGSPKGQQSCSKPPASKKSPCIGLHTVTAPSLYHSEVRCFCLAGRCRKSWDFKELKCCFQCCSMLFPTPGPGILFFPFGIRELFRFYAQSHWHLCCPCDWTLGISKAALFPRHWWDLLTKHWAKSWQLIWDYHWFLFFLLTWLFCFTFFSYFVLLYSALRQFIFIEAKLSTHLVALAALQLTKILFIHVFEYAPPYLPHFNF